MTREHDYVMVPRELIDDTLVVLQDHWTSYDGIDVYEDVEEVCKRWWAFLDGEEDE